jgi:hypothetical protein
LPSKPVALHPVASTPPKALKCFCLSPLIAEKDYHLVLGTVWPLTARQDAGLFQRSLKELDIFIKLKIRDHLISIIREKTGRSADPAALP